tara:strand:- start:1059 stop:3710 length:2652 start_codon:yes stop_codon:yes gene_type:complete
MKFVGAWEQRVQMMVHELHTRQDVLYVDDLPSLVYTGRSSHSDTNVAEYIEPHISRGELRIIGECTPERLEATREESPSFFARFRVIQIPELDEKQTLMVLVHAMRRMEALEHLTIQPEALESILSLTRRFLVHHCYPGKAINLLMQLLSDYRNIERDRFKRRLITREHLIEFFSRQSGLPSFILWEQQARPHKEIKSYFARRIIGQDDAVETVTDVVTILQQGLNNPERPLATLMFVGPTGVGKTETAKALAEYLFGSAERLIRFDMSEFMHPSAVTRLIGDRFQPEGDLTRQVQQQPFSVILLDEVEKAHPSIFDAFLQVLGEGRLTNAAGHTIDFCNTVVIMTSNLGVKEANRSLGFATQDESQAQLHYRKAAESFFRPEFFNRIDRIVAFSKLTRASISPLVKRLLQQLLNRRGLRHSHVLVQVDPELVELLIDQGFDPQYGARSMKRLLEQRLTVPLAQHLVSHSVHQTTVIQLFRKKDNIGMELWGLEEIILKPFEHLKKARRWNELKLRFEQLKHALQGMEKSDELKQIVQERSELLATFNADEDNTDPPERLLSLSELLGGQMQLRKFIEQFEEDYMVDYHFIETSDHWYSQSKLWGPQKNTAFSQEPIELDRQRLFPEAQEKIFQARIDFASLLYRTKAIQEDNLHPAILRFLPASESQSTQRWSIQLAQQFASSWSDWATIKYFARKQDKWEEIESKEWSEWYEQLRMGEEEVLQFFPESRMLEVQGVAITLHGPGMRPLLEDELGFYQHNAQEGPDLICDLVRIEEVSDSLRLPLEQLHHLDEAFEAYRETRRKGLDAENPRPQLPLIRVFNDGACEDQETGELIDHWKLDKDLHKIAMLRIFARFLAHTEQTAQPIDDVHDEPTSDDTQEA